MRKSIWRKARPRQVEPQQTVVQQVEDQPVVTQHADPVKHLHIDVQIANAAAKAADQPRHSPRPVDDPEHGDDRVLKH